MADAEDRGESQERTRQVFAARREEKYRRAQRAATSGRRRKDDEPRRGLPAEGGTRFVEPSPGAIRRVGRFLRSLS